MATRKKKTDGPAVPASERAVASEAFKDLIKTAQSEAKWERGRGRGFGRGRGRGREQRFTVAFGGGDSAQGRFLPSAKKDKVKEEDMDIDDPGGRRKAKKEKGPMLDYSQYYPTLLPFRPPEEEGKGLPAEDSLLGIDLATAPEEDINAAEELGLVGEEPGVDELYLFQLPNMLPAQPAPPEPEEERKTTRGPTPAQKAQPTAMSLKELQSGKIGKLMIHASGAVRMQLGDVLYNVDPGMICGCRQEVAAINTSVGHCILMGDITQRVVVSANIWQLMSEGEFAPSGKKHPDVMEEDMDDVMPLSKAANGTAHG